MTKKTGAQLRAEAEGNDGNPLKAEHECTPSCHRYSFHDERRAFATMNATNMTLEALQALMRHKSSSTTLRYINLSKQLNPAVANLHVPDVLKIGNA